MVNCLEIVRLGSFLTERKQFFTIDDFTRYKRARVQLHGKGVVLRDEVQGVEVKTKLQQAARIGEFLVAEIDAKVGGFGIVPANLGGAIVSSHYFLFEVNEQKCLQSWLDWYIRSGLLEDQVIARGSTNYAAIRPSHVLNFVIPLPPLDEQRRIVARIEALAARVSEAQRLRREAIEKSEFLVDEQIDEIFLSLKNKPIKPLSELTIKIGSGSTPKGGRSIYPESGIPFIRSMNVRMRRFQWNDIAYIDFDTHKAMQGTRVKFGDVLLNITGASIGRVTCAPENLVEGNVNQHVAIIRPITALIPRFLMYWLSQPTIQEFINSEQKGATRQGFTKSQIEKFHIPILNTDDQERIVTYLDNLQAEVDSLKAIQFETQKELDSLMPSILDKAFKGEL